MFDPSVFDAITVVDPLAVVDAFLILGLTTLGGIVRSQSLRLDELRTKQRAQEVELGNKLATIEQLTGYDALTGLRGQRWFETELAEALRGKRPVALIYIDLDGIKQLNTSRGHQYVDGVIRSAAMAIRASLRRETDRDLVFRRGDAADEFLVILDGADLTLGLATAQQILTTLRLLPTTVTASIGVAASDGENPMCAAYLERAAETAMDWAKADGKNCVRPVAPMKVAEPAQTSEPTVPAQTAEPTVAEHVTPAALPQRPSDAIPVEVTDRIEVTDYVAA